MHTFPLKIVSKESILQAMRPKLHELQNLTFVSYDRLLDLWSEWANNNPELIPVNSVGDLFALWVQYAYDNWAFGISRYRWVEACLEMGVEIVM